ncbi:adenylate/guanylate cyclase domain-containing protein [Pontibacter pamirensis]|uniref:adenylate/guanylate cyclase domain-containing protein n=1 Tax=Pontibacter pamirensis TaxID=2562824 RepID=UPI00138A15F4|nr:adenylate/guanylate cyclase domain-containing protein [Pontibacter pamirensis]
MIQTRQLAAIMFTDIAGYTALMGSDERKAFELLNQNRRLHKPLIETYGGKWIKEMGDGVLASFPTVTDAVACACALVQGCGKVEGLCLRIGIHLGEVVFENEDVFGDGVNIASRLQALAPAGGIWVSEAVHQNVANKKDIVTRLVGEETLKNVKEPVRVYEVYPKGSDSKTSMLNKNQTTIVQAKSIAVLPFVNMSNDPEQEYFSDGIAEEITSSLTHLEDLKVAGRTSSSQFKGTKVDLREVGEKLGVATVLEGSVRKQGDRLRITAQLNSAADGFHLWSEKYDRNMDDIFAIQDEIALAITEQLKITLLGNDREKLTKPTTRSTEAYELYLKGRFHINRRGGSIMTGQHLFKQAIALDPNYALAYAGYADALTLSAGYGFQRGREVMKEAKLAAQKAITLDDTLGEAYGALGFYYIGLEWNWTLAERNYLKSIELNPKYAQTHSLYGMLYLGFVQGKFDEAVERIHIALKLEPLSAIDHADMAWTLYVAGKFEEALTYAKTGVDLDANSFLSLRIAGLCYMQLRHHDEAIKTLKHLVKMSKRHQHAINSLLWAYCSKGDIDEAVNLMHELEKRAKTEYIAGTYTGLSAAYLGDLDAAFTYLERAYFEHDANLLNIRHSQDVPVLLQKEKRFQNLIDRIGFPKSAV